jgi:hypothetical protein
VLPCGSLWGVIQTSYWVSPGATFPFLGCRTEEYGLSDRQSTGASDRAVDSRGVSGAAADVAHRDGDGGGVVPLAE